MTLVRIHSKIETAMSNNIYYLFENQVKKNPLQIALVCGEQQWTYGQLQILVNNLAVQLLENGVKQQNLVALILERSENVFISILATLKIGAAYVPIDIEMSKQKIADILHETDAKIIVTQRKGQRTVTHHNRKTILVEEAFIVEQNQHLSTVETQPSDLAYVVYTSGSTGKPKGTMVSHANLLSIYKCWEDVYALSTEVKNHLQMANLSFDVFSGDWVRALCSGGKLVVCRKFTFLRPKLLYKLLYEQKIHFAEFVPTTLRLLVGYLEENKKDLAFMKIVVCGSDSWSIREYIKFKMVLNTRLINSYGLSEATIDSTYFEADMEKLKDYPVYSNVPIGKPFANTNVYIVNEERERIKNNAVGEIYLSGDGISLGYLNRPELTKEKFVNDIWKPGQILLKTGDLGQYLPDGNIELLGRIDSQIKINGVRVDASEIEDILNDIDGIVASMTVQKSSNHRRLLVAYIVFKKDFYLNKKQIVDYLATKIEKNLFPKHYYEIKELPLLSCGKINRKAVINATPII